MPKIQCELTLEQTDAVCDGLDAFTRLCLGQLEEVAHLVRHGVIPMAQPIQGGERRIAPPEVCDQITLLMDEVKRLLGYPRSGNHGIGHAHVALAGRRAYEIQKVLAKVLAEQRNPHPDFRGVNYDGLGPRYTLDPAPVAACIN